jgi:hypothetical protein
MVTRRSEVGWLANMISVCTWLKCSSAKLFSAHEERSIFMMFSYSSLAHSSFPCWWFSSPSLNRAATCPSASSFSAAVAAASASLQRSHSHTQVTHRLTKHQAPPLSAWWKVLRISLSHTHSFLLNQMFSGGLGLAMSVLRTIPFRAGHDRAQPFRTITLESIYYHVLLGMG